MTTPTWLRSKRSPLVTAFLVDGIAPPGAGLAFAIGAHRMRDAEAFKPYIARVPDVIKDYGCRYIARGGAVTPLCGSFAPDRLVLMEFPRADEVVAFYCSAVYAPLLRIRLKATDPRFVLMARTGAAAGTHAAGHRRGSGQSLAGPTQPRCIFSLSCPAKAGHPLFCDRAIAETIRSAGSPAFAGDDGCFVALSVRGAIARRRRGVPAIPGRYVAGSAAARRLARHLRRRHARAGARSVAARSRASRPAGNGAAAAGIRADAGAISARADVRSAGRARQATRGAIPRHASPHREGVRRARQRACWRSGRARPITAAIRCRTTPSACWRRRPIPASARISSATNSCTC